MTENYPHLPSTDVSTPESCTRLHTQYIPQKDQNEDLFTCKVEVKEEEDDPYSGNNRCKEEEIPSKICTDTRDTGKDVLAKNMEEGCVRIKEEEVPVEISSSSSSIQNPSERCPCPLYSTQKHQKIPQEGQDENLIKVEVKDEEIMKNNDFCKEEETPLEIGTDGLYVGERPHTSSLVGEMEDDNMAEPSKEDHRTQNTHSVLQGNEDGTFLCSEPNQRFNLTSTQTGPQKEKPYQCPECGKCFSQKQQRVRHQKTHSTDRPFSCSECGKCFIEKWKLTKHQHCHSGEKPFSCLECGRCFANKRILISHHVTHTGEKPFSCAECGKCYSQMSTLITHKKIHTGVKPYSCSECGKCFSYKSSLIGHEKVHTGEKPFSCIECGRCFSLRSTLIAHEKVHTGEKLYSCAECGRSFTHKSSLVKHEKVHTGERPYPCSECGKRFKNRSNLVFHQRRLHREKK